MKIFSAKPKIILDNALISEYNISMKNKNNTQNKESEMVETTAKAKNYSDEMVAKMHDLYVANPTRETVELIAEQFGKSVRSVIAKLSREGIYVSQPRVTKTGEPVVRKSELVAQIEAQFDIEMPTLVKASKADLQTLINNIS